MPRYTITVELEYYGAVDPQEVKELVESALEHCRQESMLTPDPTSDTQSCDWVVASTIEETRP